MGLQLGMNESANIILAAIRHAGENLNVDLSHTYSKPGNQGFYTEVNDFTLEIKLHRISKDYNKDDHTFSLNFPYEYFNSDAVKEDTILGLSAIDHVEVKAEIRCMYLITKTYNNWIKDHEVFTTQDLRKIFNQALDKLRMLKKFDLMVHGNGGEIAEKYMQAYLTEEHIPVTGRSSIDRWFSVEVRLSEYYDDVGNNAADGLIGEGNLRGKPREEICLLRVAYIIYSECIGWLRNKWPKTYQKYKNGEF